MSPDQRFRLHIENLRSQPAVFHVTPERYADASRRHSDLAERIDVSIGWDLENFAPAMREADFLIGWKFPRDSIGATAPNLKWIHLTGAGIEHVLPLDWLPRGMVLTNNRGVHAAKAGEYIAMAVLALNTRLPYYATNKPLRRWDRIFASGVVGKTLVVVGVGNMGSAGARRCKDMGMRVIGIRSNREPLPYVDEMYGPDDLHRVLPLAHFLLLTVPLTERTRGLIGRAELDLLKPEAGIINIARAGVMDYVALGEKLKQGELSGAILDVFDPEPLPPDSFVWDLPNVIITPHVSSDDADSYIPDTLDLFFNNFRRFLAGEPLHNRVDPKRQY